MLSKKFRLAKRKDFEKVIKQGKYFSEQFVVLKIVPNDLVNSRFAFAVSVKVDKKATVRNRIRRRLRELIRANLINIKPGFDIILIPKKEITEKSYQEIASALSEALKAAKLI